MITTRAPDGANKTKLSEEAHEKPAYKCSPTLHISKDEIIVK